MRKFLALAALVLGLASCQNEPEGLNVVTGGEVDTVVTVTLPEAETRSSADSALGIFNGNGECTEGTMRYILQVYYNGDTNAQSRQVKYSTGPSVSFPVRLVPDRNYQFVVWADVVDAVNADSEYYDTADLKNITLKADSWEAMDEKRDAFTASETINFNAAKSINIPLYRPFAKLRVVTTDYNVLKNIGDGSIVAHKAKVVYTTKHRTSFNAYTSEAGPAYEVKSHKYDIKTYANESDAARTIFSDYFFAENDVVRFDIEVYEANGTLIKKTSFPTDINVKRNYLTTLKGDVLTEGNNVGVTVVPGFGNTNDDYDYNVVTSVNDLITAVNNGGNYKIGAHLDIDSSLLPPTTLAATRSTDPKTTVIDFNGYTITVRNTNLDNTKAIITVGAGNTLVFEGEGSIILTDDSTAPFINGTVVLEGGEINNEAQIPVVNGTVYENGGVVNDNVTPTATAAAWLEEVCKNGGTFNLSEDLTINATTKIEATKPVVINGNGNTITFTANRGFRITEPTVAFENVRTVAFENVTIVNNVDGGRCVETRTGGINLTFNNVNLTATKGSSQPFTVGGSGDNLVVNFNNSTVDAGTGYGITTFNPVALNINNSTVSGYSALNIQSASESLGSARSVINVVNSTLAGINNAAQHESNSFSTVAIVDDNITINIDGNSKLVADPRNNAQALFGFGNSVVTETMTGCKIVVAVGAEIEINEEKGSYVGLGTNQKYLYDNVVKFPAAYAANLKAEGWIVSEPVNGLVTILNTVSVSSDAELEAAVNAGATTIFLADGVYYADKGCAGKTLTLNGSKNTVLKLKNEGEDGCDYSFGSPNGVGNITFNGLTIDTTENTGNYKGFAYMNGIFNNCNFVGAYSLNNNNDFAFNNCTFDFKNGYFWTWAAKSVTFDNCTFNGNSKTILAHGYANTVININNCNFAATEKGYTGAGDNTACVEIDPASDNTYTITFTGTNTKSDKYAGWTRVKDGSTGHTITGIN